MAADGQTPYELGGNKSSDQAEMSTSNRGAGTTQIRILVEPEKKEDLALSIDKVPALRAKRIVRQLGQRGKPRTFRTETDRRNLPRSPIASELDDSARGSFKPCFRDLFFSGGHELCSSDHFRKRSPHKDEVPGRQRDKCQGPSAKRVCAQRAVVIGVLAFGMGSLAAVARAVPNQNTEAFLSSA